MHFDHERIPERVVHARGAAAHGFFEGYGTAGAVSLAAALRARTSRTPVFVRFSTVLGSRGSADTVRDTRGFAMKFYTDEGSWDLVGNNMPVFFIQDGIKFPDVIHAGKPHPDREIPQAQSAHDTFWDFVSLHTEAQHHTIWNMSDRGIPRSYRMMEGFGVHTFRCINDDGGTSLVKFHWKPRLGVHSLTWEEAQLLGGIDPDFHRRDLADAIEAGAFPEWELGVQVMPDTEDQMFEGIDLLDPTKLVPEELAPVQPIGRLVLDRNPTNYFAETEQVAFHTGHLVPGIDVTDDPLLQARNFSYLDTQLTAPRRPELRPAADQPAARAGQRHAARRLPPARRPQRRRALPPELARRRLPLHDGRPGGTSTTRQRRAFVEVARTVGASQKSAPSPRRTTTTSARRDCSGSASPRSSRSTWCAPTRFELGKCYERPSRSGSCRRWPTSTRPCAARSRPGSASPRPRRPSRSPDVPSPGAGQVRDERGPWTAARSASSSAGTRPRARWAARRTIFARVWCPWWSRRTGASRPGDVQRTFATGRSVELDALLLLDAPPPAPDALESRDEKAAGEVSVDPRVLLLAEECFRHSKAVAATGAGADALLAAGLPDGRSRRARG